MKTQRKKEKNIFVETDQRYNRVHHVVSKLWPDGERFRKRCPNLQLARQLLARINGAIVTGQWEALKNELTPKKKQKVETPVAADAETVTFGRLAEEFKHFINGRKSLSDWPTIQGYLVDAMTNFFAPDTPIVEFNLKTFEDFIEDRVADDIRACTVNKDLSVLRAMFKKAVDWYGVSNPTAGLENLADDSLIHDRYLQPKEIDTLLNTARQQHDVISPGLVFRDLPEFIIVAVNTGLRLSELLTLPFAHINFEQRILSVKNKPGKRTKNGTERHIRFNHDTFDALVELRRKAVNPFGTIFQLPDGSSWLAHKRAIQHQFRECVQSAGLYTEDRTRNVTIHTLRHTFGSQLAIQGIPLRRIQELMGHESITTTERYAHLLPEETDGDTEVLQGMATNRQRQPVGVAANSL